MIAALLGSVGCSGGVETTIESSGTAESSAYGIALGDEGTAQGIPGIADGTPVRVIEDVDHKPVAVPVQPQRVVSLSEPTLDGALALGVTPVGSVNGRGQSGMPNYLLELTEGIPSVGTVAQFNYEAIAAHKPDLILTYASGGNNPEAVEIMSRIAPVYFVGYAGADWEKTFRGVANALNKVDEGERVLTELDDYANSVKSRLVDAGYADKTFSIVRWQGSNASLILKELPPGMALEKIGLKRPPAQDREGRGHSEPISLENLQDADADYMFFGTLGGSSVANPDAGGATDVEGARAAYEQAEEVPGFTELNAYRNDNVILVDGSLWTSTGGPLLLKGIIEFVEETLL
jgi:iron complex transport system substrate-binding protein